MSLRAWLVLVFTRSDKGIHQVLILDIQFTSSIPAGNIQGSLMFLATTWLLLTLHCYFLTSHSAAVAPFIISNGVNWRWGQVINVRLCTLPAGLTTIA